MGHMGCSGEKLLRAAAFQINQGVHNSNGSAVALHRFLGIPGTADLQMSATRRCALLRGDCKKSGTKDDGRAPFSEKKRECPALTATEAR